MELLHRNVSSNCSSYSTPAYSDERNGSNTHQTTKATSPNYRIISRHNQTLYLTQTQWEWFCELPQNDNLKAHGISREHQLEEFAIWLILHENDIFNMEFNTLCNLWNSFNTVLIVPQPVEQSGQQYFDSKQAQMIADDKKELDRKSHTYRTDKLTNDYPHFKTNISKEKRKRNSIALSMIEPPLSHFDLFPQSNPAKKSQRLSATEEPNQTTSNTKEYGRDHSLDHNCKCEYIDIVKWQQYLDRTNTREFEQQAEIFELKTKVAELESSYFRMAIMVERLVKLNL